MPSELKIVPSMVHIYEIMRRRKDNRDGVQEHCFRHVDYEMGEIDHKLAYLKMIPTRIQDCSGYWRIYRTVNRRNVNKAMIEFTKKMVEEIGKPWLGDQPKTRNVETLWRTILLQPENKAENRWLLDIDGPPETFVSVRDYLNDNRIEIKDQGNTKSGYFMVTDRFDRREFDQQFSKEVDIKKDALQYVHGFQIG